jgi:hypothetical protein
MTKQDLVEATGASEKTVGRALADLGAVAKRPGPRGPKQWSLPLLGPSAVSLSA